MTELQRLILGAYAGAVAALARITIYQDFAALNNPIQPLRARGIRQITLQVFNSAAITLELYTLQPGSNSYVLYDTLTIPVYSATNKNAYTYDVSGFRGVLLQLVDLGSGQSSTFSATLEGQLTVENSGCI